MKIVCGSCQAKYSIADEKVAGKVFRIRCKRCGEVIVVRGDQESAGLSAANGNGHAEQEQAGAEAPPDAIWHVVINGEQAGPYTPAQLGELIAGGQLDWEAYVWCEGFDNWQPMRDVAELVNAISGQQEEAPAAAPAVAAVPSMGADPFADEAPAPPVVFAKAAGGGGGGVVQTSNITSSTTTAAGGMAAPSPTALSTGFDPNPRVVASGPSPRVSAEQAMTGARNENSVLFSLKNLQALATGSLAPAAGPSNRPGYAAGEGSGLIDIRALASTTGVSAEPSKNSEKDALLSLGSAQAGAFGALGSPMLSAPGKADDEGGKKHLMIAIIAGFALLAVAGIGIAFIMKPSGSTPSPVVAPVAPAPPMAAPQPTAAAPAPQPSQAAPAEPPSEGERAAAVAPHSKEPSAEDTSKHNKGGKHPGSEKPDSVAAAPKPEPEPAAKPEKAGPKKSSAGASIDDLLNGALGGKQPVGGNSKASDAAASANLPEKPSRDDVMNSMKSVTDAVKACGKGQSGVAFATITVIGKTGRVSNVEVTGITGEPGSCIAKAVRKASFPKFKSDNFQVRFPFRL